MIRLAQVNRGFAAVVAMASLVALSGPAAGQELNAMIVSSNGVTVVVPQEELKNAATEKRLGSATGTLVQQAKDIQSRVGKFERKVTFEVSSKTDVIDLVTTKETITVKMPAGRMRAVDTGIALVMARAADLGVKAPSDADPAIMSVAFLILIPSDQEKSIKDALTKHGVLGTKRLGEYNTKGGTKLSETESLQLPATLWVIAKHWTEGEKKPLADLLVLTGDKMPDPEKAKAWYLKK